MSVNYRTVKGLQFVEGVSKSDARDFLSNEYRGKYFEEMPPDMTEYGGIRVGDHLDVYPGGEPEHMKVKVISKTSGDTVIFFLEGTYGGGTGCCEGYSYTWDELQRIM